MSAIQRIITPKMTNLGEFSVRRLLPNSQQRAVGPWVFFDHAGPVTLAPGPGINVRPHPHINLATVTYLFAGEILHRDSLGCEQLIRPGDINLMVAGKGIVHSERERGVMQEQHRDMHLLQLWLALPEADEETEAEFLHYPRATLPTTEINGIPVQVLIGSAFGLESPVKTFASTLYAIADMTAGQSLPVNLDEDELALYVAEGEIRVGGQSLAQYSLAVMDNSSHLSLEANTDSRIALIGGDTLSQRRVWWNFVSSRPERIEQAKRDWVEGRFPTVPGDEEEFIPLPER